MATTSPTPPASLATRLAKIVFEPAEEVKPADIKEGEWYIWNSEGFGYPKNWAFLSASKYANDEVQCIYPDTQSNSLYSRQIGIPESAEKIRSSYGTTSLFKSRLFRAKQQPEISKKDFSTVFATALGSFHRPYSGTDPEVFVEDAAGKVIPAYTFLKSKKESPCLYYDGFQAEFAPIAGSCQDGLAQRIERLLRDLAARAPKGSKFSPRSVVEIPLETLATATHEQVEFGCRPSLNAYGLAGEVILEPRTFPLRFAGGHIHWGIGSNYDPAVVQDAVKFVDLVAGLISVSISEGLDDPRRRRYYGLAGEYRLPAHGVEYRSLSNSWLASPSVYHLLFTLGRAALGAGLKGWRERIMEVPEIAVVNAINNSDHELARGLIRAQKDLFLGLIRGHWLKDSWVNRTYELIQQPMTAWGVHPKDMLANWRDLRWDSAVSTGSSPYPQRWSSFLEKAGV